MEHDQRFKTLLRTFFADFLQLFFAEWAERFDLSHVEWLDKELLAVPGQETPHVADMVARVAAKQAVLGGEKEPPWLVLVHIEIESGERATDIKARMPRYYHQLRATYDLPVLPIVVYLRMQLQGIGEDVYVERFWELEISTFRYLYVGLAALDGVRYVEGENWLGVALAALMRFPPERAAWLGAEALRRLTTAQVTPTQRFLLAECARAYLDLNEAQKLEYDRMLHSQSFTGVRAMAKSYYEEGIEKGIEKGRLLDRQESILAILEERIGEVSPALRKHIESLSWQDLSTLLRKLAKAETLTEAGLGEFEG